MSTIEYNEAESFHPATILDTMFREKPINTVVSFQLTEKPEPGQTLLTHGTYRKNEKGMYALISGQPMFYDTNDEQLGAEDGMGDTADGFNQLVYPDEIVSSVDFWKLSIRFINVPNKKTGGPF